jgi:hypothetical protein
MNANATKPTPSWHDVLPIHPACELFPPMSPDELRALGEDIKTNGLTSPIVLWQPDPKSPACLLDGRNRLDSIAMVSGRTVRIKPLTSKTWQVVFANGELIGDIDRVTVLDKSVDPYTYVISANVHRRHFTAQQKRELIAELIKAQPEKSDRQIAERVKASPTTVGAVREKIEASGDVSKLDTRKDTKGRRQPARKEKQPDEQPAVIRNPPKTENKKEETALRRSDIEPAAISEVASKIIRADLQAARELYRILVAGGGDAACRFVRELAAGLENEFATDLAERAENAIVASPAADPAEQPADVIEPDDCDGELV